MPASRPLLRRSRPRPRAARLLLLLPLLLPPAAGCGGPESGAGAAEGDGGGVAAPGPLFFPRRLTEPAPPTFRARFHTSAGEFVVEVHRAWSPHGADRFWNLVKHGYYDDTRVYRVVAGFMAQFGVHGDPVLGYQWRNSVIPDDPVVESNTRGRVSFARSGANSRINEVFINLRDNPSLDAEGFSPIGEVVEGMAVVDAFHAGYGDGPPRGDGPYQAQARAQGNAYLDTEFPELTRIERVTVTTGG
ncbi:MAG: peptidylprolyl isomerase [Longimicrobiales bacterium]|nr:peptidylprolyl isomerase [Longimicrobiales bacterium]